MPRKIVLSRPPFVWHIVSRDPRCVMIAPGIMVHCGTRARAKLIAAAPAMEECLRDLTAYLELEGVTLGEMRRATRKVLAQLRKA